MNNSGKIHPDAFKKLNERIHLACEKSGRNVDEVQIVAVTKSFCIKAINSALDLGIHCIGENKVQEVETKIPQLTKRQKKEIHFIGHLQSNKIRKVLNLVDVIETVDSLKLANRINNISREINKKTTAYLQVNTGNDTAKFGFSTDEILNSANEISKMENINLLGIMTIPPILKDKKELKVIFNETRKIKDKIQNQIQPNCKNLSMGMSSDFELAIECGATHIRLGTILFGNRDYN